MTASADSPVPTPSVGHVCEGTPTGRKPRLCWICGQFLPHDCVGSAHVQPCWTTTWKDRQPIGATQGSVTVSPAGANVLIGTIHDQPRFLVERADVADLIACLVWAYAGAQPTHGPPQKVELPTPGACIYPEPANRLAPPIAPTGRKWPIGTPDETVYGSAYSTADEWHLRLRAARINCGLTLDALARRLDPPRTRKDISAMEHGRRGLSVELCAQLADALDCDRLWLAGWTLEAIYTLSDEQDSCLFLVDIGQGSARVISRSKTMTNETMTAAELTAALTKIAKSDLRTARKEGYMLIGQTKRGTLALRHSDGIYTLSTQGSDSAVIAQGKPAVVVPVLASCYSVVM